MEFAGEGAAVVVNYKDRKDDAEAVVEQIKSGGGTAFAFQADVTSEADVRKLVDFTIRQFSRIDILVCNAGIVRDQLVAVMSLDDWESVIGTHLRGTFLCVRETTPYFMSQKSGSIVTISSIAADKAGRGHANYAAAKGGINALTRSLAIELAPKGIRVNAVSPGVILTDMTKRIRNLAEKEIIGMIPLKRLGEPEEVAIAVRFLASKEAAYITGEVLHVTGGFGL